MQTLKTECLDHFVICGEVHLRHIVREFVTHCHEECPHQAKGNAQRHVALVSDDALTNDAKIENAKATSDTDAKPDVPRILEFPSAK